MSSQVGKGSSVHTEFEMQWIANNLVIFNAFSFVYLFCSKPLNINWGGDSLFPKNSSSNSVEHDI